MLNIIRIQFRFFQIPVTLCDTRAVQLDAMNNYRIDKQGHLHFK